MLIGTRFGGPGGKRARQRPGPFCPTLPPNLFAAYSATRGAANDKRYAAAHRPPSFGLPPGGLCLAVRSALPPARPLSGASPAACGVTAAPCRFPPRLAGSACRRLPRPAAPPPPPAPLRLAAPPAAASGGSVPRPSPWSLRSPLPAAGGPPARPPLPAGSLRSLGRRRAVGPPGSAPPASCPPSSLGRLAAWSGFGLRGSRPGLRRPSGPLSSALRPGRGGLGYSAAAAASGGSAPRPPSATPGGGGQGSSRAAPPPLTRPRRVRQTASNRCRRRRVPPTPAKMKGWCQKWEIALIAAGGKTGYAITRIQIIWLKRYRMMAALYAMERGTDASPRGCRSAPIGVT